MYLRQIGKKWYFTVVVNLPGGKKKKIERVGGKTKKEAREAALALIRSENANGEYCLPGNITLKECVTKWLETIVKTSYSPNTYDTYCMVARTRIFKYIGDVKLKDLTTMTLQKHMLDIVSCYSNAIITMTGTVLRKSLDMAVNQEQWLAANPMNNVVVRHVNRKAYNRGKMIFTREELDIIFTHFDRYTYYYLPIQLAYHMGMRSGECLALCWSDVDFDQRCICVHSTRYDPGRLQYKVLERTKNGESRTIIMDDRMFEILKEQKEQQEQDRRRYQDLYYESDFVCRRENGRPITRGNINYINNWLKSHGIDGHFHMFRHTHATMLLEAGLDLDYVSKRLGHASISTTSKIYLHITAQRNKEALDLMNKTLT